MAYLVVRESAYAALERHDGELLDVSPRSRARLDMGDGLVQHPVIRPLPAERADDLLRALF